MTLGKWFGIYLVKMKMKGANNSLSQYVKYVEGKTCSQIYHVPSHYAEPAGDLVCFYQTYQMVTCDFSAYERIHLKLLMTTDNQNHLFLSCAHQPGQWHRNIPAAQMQHISPRWWLEGRREPCCSPGCDQWVPSRPGRWRWMEQSVSSTHQKWHQWKREAPAGTDDTMFI